jgi:diguanylate cyclase (GGDEF)-like protein
LLNKEAFIAVLNKQLNSLRKNDHLDALLFINIDGLRYINNTYGHHEGDLVLQHIAAVLEIPPVQTTPSRAAVIYSVSH